MRLTVEECGLAITSGLWMGPDQEFHTVASNSGGKFVTAVYYTLFCSQCVTFYGNWLIKNW